MKWFDESLSHEALDDRLGELLKTETEEETLSEIKQEYATLVAKLLEEKQTSDEETAVEAPAAEAPSEASENPAKKKLSGRVKIGIGMSVLAVLIIVGCAAYALGQPKAAEEAAEAPEEIVYTIPADGNPDDVTCKGTYTAPDSIIEDRSVVVAKCGNAELTLGQLQTYYWMEVRSFLSQYGQYIAYLGLDMQQDFDVQPCSFEEGLTWQQFFLKTALETWQSYSSMTQTAVADGAVMNELLKADLDAFLENLEENAKQNGFESGTQLLENTMGKGATAEEYKDFMENYYTGYSYYNQWTLENAPTEAEVEAFFAEHEADYLDQGLTKETTSVSVRHVLYTPEETVNEETKETTISDEAWKAAEEIANAAFTAWKNGDATEEAFSDLAVKESQDPGSKEAGGLYEGVMEGQMVPEFNDWCFDPARQPGDSGIVKTTYGYHLMYFVGSHTLWQDTARNDLTTVRTQDFLAEVADGYPLEVEYGKIQLTSVPIV